MTSMKARVPALLSVLAGALLAVITAVPLGAGEAAQAVSGPRATVARTVTVPAAAFSPGRADVNYENSGYHLWLTSGSGGFTAPLFFEAPEVTIRRITLFAVDSNPAGDVCVWTYRTVAGDQELMGTVCSSGADLGRRQFTQTDFEYRRITGNHGPFLRLSLPGDSAEGYYFFGVRITYTFESGF